MSNVSSPDRVIRIVVGLLLLLAPFVSGWSIWGNGLATALSAIVGVVLIGTAVVGFCPIYALLGLSSKRNTTKGA